MYILYALSTCSRHVVASSPFNKMDFSSKSRVKCKEWIGSILIRISFILVNCSLPEKINLIVPYT